MPPREQALWFLRGRNPIASLPTGPSDFSGAHIACLHDSRPCRLHGAATYTYVWAAEMRLRCENALSMQIGVLAANGQSAANCRWAANWRLGCNWGSGSKMAFKFVPKQAIRTFRRHTSYVYLTTGSAEFAGPQSLCVPANRPYGLFGHGHRMLPTQQALW